MKFVLSLFAAIAVAVVVGLGSVWLAVGEGMVLRPLRLGLWSAWPAAGQPSPDPYTRAVIARSGQVPLGGGEAVVLYAARDDAGAPLRGGCVYRFAGHLPDMRLWTLEVVDGAGAVSGNPLGRYAIGSDEVVEAADGSVEVVLAPRARPGNWLPIARAGTLTAVLRLYDPQGFDPATLKTMTWPRLEPMGCAP